MTFPNWRTHHVVDNSYGPTPWEEAEMSKLVCAGRHCEGPCSKDDCFLYRRAYGYPDMRWDSPEPEPPMSEHVAEGLRLRAEVEAFREKHGNVPL